MRSPIVNGEYYGEESKQLPYDMETFDQITKDINENVISMHISCD